jgi:hypothetical protein
VTDNTASAVCASALVANEHGRLCVEPSLNESCENALGVEEREGLADGPADGVAENVALAFAPFLDGDALAVGVGVGAGLDTIVAGAVRQ